MSIFGASIAFVVMLSIVFALAVPVLVVWLLVTLVRRSGDGVPRQRFDPAVEALRGRYARGEISAQEFEEGMRLLGYERFNR